MLLLLLLLLLHVFTRFFHELFGEKEEKLMEEEVSKLQKEADLSKTQDRGEGPLPCQAEHASSNPSKPGVLNFIEAPERS